MHLKKVIKTFVETLSICVSQCVTCIHIWYTPWLGFMDPQFRTADTNDPWEVMLHCCMSGSFTLGNTYPTCSVTSHTTRMPDYTAVKTFNFEEWYLVKQRPKSDLYTMPFWNRYYFMTRSAHIVRWWNAG